MATTHEFPTDRVHFTWDVDNEPVLTVESGDTVVYETRSLPWFQVRIRMSDDSRTRCARTVTTRRTRRRKR